jgi:Domain of unknown function (DUF222)
VWGIYGNRLGGDAQFRAGFSLILLGKRLSSNTASNTMEAMELGDSTTAERDQRSLMDEALDTFDAALTDLINTVETGGLDRLEADQQLAVWHHFERLRNKLPLVDHRLIADADAADLPRQYCSATMTQFLVRILQLSHGEAAARVRAAAALGPRTSMLGERLEPLLPGLAVLQRHGVVSAAKVQIVERAMHKLTRPSLDPAAVQRAEQLLTEQAPILGPAELQRFAHAVVAAADPDGPEPVDDQRQQARRYVELTQRRDGMWHLQGRLTNTVGAQLNVILDPLTTPRSTAIEDEDGNLIQIPDQRPCVQRLHDALEQACVRLLKSHDQPTVGGVPASVIITIGLEELLAKTGLAETADGTQLSPQQLLNIADEAEIWPTIINGDGVPLALGRTRRLASPGQTMALIARDAGCSFPGCTPPSSLVRPTPHPGLDPRRSYRS